MKHKEITIGDIHLPFEWIWADTSERQAQSALESTDIGKIGLQLDNYTVWICTTATPDFIQLTSSCVTSMSTTYSSEVSNTRNITITFNRPITGFVIIWVSTAPGGAITTLADISLGGLWHMGDDATSCLYMNGTSANISVTYTGSGLIYINAALPNGTVVSNSGITYS